MNLHINHTMRLELVNAGHAQELYELALKNYNQIAEWMPWIQNMKSQEFIEQFIKHATERYHQNMEHAFVLVLDNAIIGRVGVYKIDPYNRIGEIGYWLDQSHEGKGYMTQSVERIIQYCFDELHLNRIEIRCGEHNIKSQSIPERLHFLKEGLLHQAEYLNGRFHNLWVYGRCRNW